MTTLQTTTLIILAPGFDLDLVKVCAARMKATGRRMSLIGLAAGPVRSDQGLRLTPDADLEQLPDDVAVDWLLLPGGRECAAALSRDPRVYRLLRAVHEDGGRIAASPDFWLGNIMAPLVPLTGELIEDLAAVERGMTASAGNGHRNRAPDNHRIHAFD